MFRWWQCQIFWTLHVLPENNIITSHMLHALGCFHTSACSDLIYLMRKHRKMCHFKLNESINKQSIQQDSDLWPQSRANSGLLSLFRLAFWPGGPHWRIQAETTSASCKGKPTHSVSINVCTLIETDWSVQVWKHFKEIKMEAGWSDMSFIKVLQYLLYSCSEMNDWRWQAAFFFQISDKESSLFCIKSHRILRMS